MNEHSEQTPTQIARDDPSMFSRIPSPVPRYFMVADILGFSEMIKNLSDAQQRQRVEEWVTLINEVTNETEVSNIQLISDTLFASEVDSVDGLERMLRFAQILLNKGAEQSFPIRGAIVHGEVAWGDMTFGRAVIRAHQLERSLDWIGIACSPDLPRLRSLWNWELVVCYPVPKKTGCNQLHGAVSWNVPQTNRLMTLVGDGGLMKVGDNYPWHVVTKVERAVQFGVHLSIGKQLGWEPSRFPGSCPTNILEAVISARYTTS